MDDILYLEPDEEITSVIDKIKNTKGPKIGLVVPRDATLLQSVVNLRLLSKEAAVLNKEIAIVTADKIGRNLAGQVGLTVYGSVQEEKPIFQSPPPVPSSQEIIELEMESNKEVPPPAGVKVHHFQQEAHPVQWRSEKKPVFVPNIAKTETPQINKSPAAPMVKEDIKPHKIFWPILSIIVVLSGIAAYLLVPKAEIVISVLSEDLKKSVAATLSEQISEPDVEQGVFPGHLVEAIKEESQKFTATGKKNIGEKAKGAVTFYNGLDSSNHALAAGTKLSSSGKTFVLKSAVTVPGATVQNLKVVPGSANGAIEAEEPGTEYNIKAGRFTIIGIPASQQEALYGQTSSALAGGFTKEVQVVSQDDYDKAKKQLMDSLSESIDELLETNAQGQEIVEQAVLNNDPEITSSAKVNQEASDFEIKIKLKKQVMVFNFNSFQEFLIQALQKNVPSGKMVAIPTKEDIGVVVDNKAYDKKQLDLTVNVNAKIAPKIASDEIKNESLGKSKSEVEKKVLAQEGVTSVEVKSWPSWWLKKIPDLARNVKVTINYLTEKE